MSLAEVQNDPDHVTGGRKAELGPGVHAGLFIGPKSL